MMGNPAAPSFVNHGKFHDYIVYRFYIIAQNPNLKYLDDRNVEEEEKTEAQLMFNSTVKMSHFSALEAASEYESFDFPDDEFDLRSKVADFVKKLTDSAKTLLENV